MSFSRFIASKISSSSRENFSSLIIKIATAAVSISVAVMIIATAIMAGFEHEITSKIYNFWGQIHINHYNSLSLFESEPIDVNKSYIQQLKNIPNIKTINTYTTLGGIIKTKDELHGIVLKGIDKTYDWETFQPYIKQGDKIAFSDSTASNDIIISEKTAKLLRLKLKDNILIYFTPKHKSSSSPSIRKFTIKAIYSTGIDEFDKIYALVDIRKTQQLLMWQPQQVAGLEIHLHNISFLEKIDVYKNYFKENESFNKIENPFEKALSFLNILMQKNSEQITIEHYSNSIFYQYTNPEHYCRSIVEVFPSIFDWIQVNNINKWVVLVLMILVSIINMITAILVLIIERTPMIGLLKTFGSNDKEIQKIFLYKAAYIIIWGLFWGNIIGIGLCFIQQYFGLIQLDEENYYVSKVPILLSFSSIILINMGSIFIILCTLILPTKIVSKITPIKALRFQ